MAIERSVVSNRFTIMSRQLTARTITPYAVTIVAFLAANVDFGIRSAHAEAFCVELTASEFNHSSNRRGDQSACAGDKTNLEGAARDRARSNANDAIARQCLNGVTIQIMRQACSRVNLTTNTSPDLKWDNAPPAAKFSADKVKYIGSAVAGGPILCAVAHDVSVRTRSVVDGSCDHGISLMPNRNFAITRARARCGVVCGAP
jgi:hypothetical protein